jgi:hypothetical protein
MKVEEEKEVMQKYNNIDIIKEFSLSINRFASEQMEDSASERGVGVRVIEITRNKPVA